MMRSRLFALALLFLPFPTSADEPVDWDMVNRIRDEGMHRSEVMAIMEHLTDKIGPRLTGSPAMNEANEWTRQQMEDWGLENAHLEPFEFGRGWSFSRTSVHMLQPREVPLNALPKAWTPGTDGPVKGQAMRVKIESEKDFEKYRGKLEGKILFLDEARAVESGHEPAIERYTEEDLEELQHFEVPDGRQPAWRQRMRKRWKLGQERNEFFVEEKVLATVSISSRDAGVIRVTGGGSREPDGNPGVPALVMSAEQYNWILRLLGEPLATASRQGPRGDRRGRRGAPEESEGDKKGDEADTPVVELEIDVRARFHDEDTNAYNTIADLPGTGEGLVITGGHLDSWHTGTGATDNAAGCAVAMEAVRILKAIGVKPKRTIRVGLWSGEEQGLLGARAHVEKHFATVPVSVDPKDKGLPLWMRGFGAGDVTVKPAHEHFSAYFNLDNGSGRLRGIWAQENAAAAQIFEAWLEPFHDLGADTVTNRNTGGTDHQAFDRVGLPGFQFIQDQLAYRSRTHHTSVDTLDHVVREDLVQASVVLASFLYHAAMRDEPLPRKPMPVYRD